MDGGPERITDDDIGRAVRRQAREVLIRGFIIATVVTTAGLLIG
jgi:hypothetical protein